MDSLAFQSKEEFFLELDEFYAGDMWDMSHCEIYSQEERNKARSFRSCIVDFNFSQNVSIKNEVKIYLRSLIHEKHQTLCYFLKHKKFVELYLTFMEKKSLTVQSILELPLQDAERHFQSYLEETGYDAYYEAKASYIDRDLVAKSYTNRSPVLGWFRQMYMYIEEITTERNEYDKDVWDIRNMGFGHKVAKSQPYYTIPFVRISQPWFKQAAKQFVLYRIKTKAVSTVRVDLKGPIRLSEFLAENRPDIHGLKQFDRPMMEEFIAWLSHFGYEPTSFNHHITGLKNMFSTLRFIEYEDVPTKKLLLSSDYRKKPTKEPEFFSDSELRRLNSHLHELPVQIARMVFVLENVGMRISDVCCMEDDCLKKNINGEYVLRYYQSKTGKTNTVPINRIVALTIEEAIRESKEKYGKACKYVFAGTAERPYLGNTFRQHMRKLAKNNDLKYDDGTPFNIKTHTFRGTVATQYANLGIDINLISLLLGHIDTSTLKHYITIHSVTMIECMRPITEMDNELIAHIGHVEDVVPMAKEPILLALPNGSCAHTDLSTPCVHANACYTCRMFRPSKCYLPLYKKQLLDTESNIAIAEINGYDRLLEMNNTLKNNLIRIIDALEKDG